MRNAGLPHGSARLIEVAGASENPSPLAFDGVTIWSNVHSEDDRRAH